MIDRHALRMTIRAALAVVRLCRDNYRDPAYYRAQKTISLAVGSLPGSGIYREEEQRSAAIRLHLIPDTPTPEI